MGPRAEVIGLAGRVAPELHRVARDPVLPGQYLKEVDCRYCSSIEEIVEAPRARAKVTPLGEWVVGNGTITRSPVIGVIEVQGGSYRKELERRYEEAYENEIWMNMPLPPVTFEEVEERTYGPCWPDGSTSPGWHQPCDPSDPPPTTTDPRVKAKGRATEMSPSNASRDTSKSVSPILAGEERLDQRHRMFCRWRLVGVYHDPVETT